MEQLKLKHFLGRSKQHALITTFLCHSICFHGNFKRRGLSLKMQEWWWLCRFLWWAVYWQNPSKEHMISLETAAPASALGQIFLPGWIWIKEPGGVEGTEHLSRDTAATCLQQRHGPAQSCSTRSCLLHGKAGDCCSSQVLELGGVEGWKSYVVK